MSKNTFGRIFDALEKRTGYYEWCHTKEGGGGGGGKCFIDYIVYLETVIIHLKKEQKEHQQDKEKLVKKNRELYENIDVAVNLMDEDTEALYFATLEGNPHAEEV